MQQNPRLALMGVPVWHARFQLPNAVNVEIDDIEVGDVNVLDEKGETVEASVDSQVIAQPDIQTQQAVNTSGVYTKDTLTPEAPVNILPEITGKAAKAASTEESDAAANVQPAVQGSPVEFELMIYQFGSLMLIDSQPAKNDPARREFAQKLAINILSSVEPARAGSDEIAAPTSSNIRWPLFNHPNAPKDKQAASVYLNNKLSLLLGDQTPTLIICAGKQAEEYCLGKGLQPGEQSTRDDYSYVVTFSLGQLLNSGDMKSEFYSHIRSAMN
jgi:hypothetical protein